MGILRLFITAIFIGMLSADADAQCVGDSPSNCHSTTGYEECMWSDYAGVCAELSDFCGDPPDPGAGLCLDGCYENASTGGHCSEGCYGAHYGNGKGCNRCPEGYTSLVGQNSAPGPNVCFKSCKINTNIDCGTKEQNGTEYYSMGCKSDGSSPSIKCNSGCWQNSPTTCTPCPSASSLLGETGIIISGGSSGINSCTKSFNSTSNNSKGNFILSPTSCTYR